MELFGLVGLALLIFFVIGFVLYTIISAIFIFVGAKVAGVKNADFKKSFFAALIESVIVWVLAIPSNIFGFIIGFLISLLILKYIFKTSWGKAGLTWLFNGIAKIILIILLVILVSLGVIAAVL